MLISNQIIGQKKRKIKFTHKFVAHPLDARIIRSAWEQTNTSFSKERATTENLLVCQRENRKAERFRGCIVKKHRSSVGFISQIQSEKIAFSRRI